jgi:hypothetical protein
MLTKVSFGEAGVRAPVLTMSYNCVFLLQCRERWANHLDPNLNKSAWSQDADMKLLFLHGVYGNRWTQIAMHMDGRRCLFAHTLVVIY